MLEQPFSAEQEITTCEEMRKLQVVLLRTECLVRAFNVLGNELWFETQGPRCLMGRQCSDKA
jgi:hypothetical protein